MKGISMIKKWSLVFLLVLYVLKAANAAPFDKQTNSVGDARSDAIGMEKISYRQANEDDSYEDSGEDDGEDDAEQAQQSLIEQQNQQNLEESLEGSDEEGGEDDNADDVRHRRRRRDIEEEQQQATTVATETVDKENQPSITTVQPSISTEPSNTPSLNRTSVLILIRDALKKVTTVLPTEQVATNALQYFQLFEHFLQQTIEQVIDDYDEDDEESTTIKINEALPEKDNNVASTEPNIIDKVEVTESINEIKVEEPEKTSIDTSPVKEPVKMIST